MFRGKTAIVLIILIVIGPLNCVAFGSSFFSWALKRSRSLVSFTPGYRRHACQQLQAAYAARIAGQDAHLAHIAKTICRHIKKDKRIKPLVILITGPPGVGKTWTTRVTAQALYTPEPILPTTCEPTRGYCAPFLQISSYSFVAANQQERYEQLLQRVISHVTRMPESLIVFEDFDRFDCSLRDFIRDMIENGPAHGLHWSRSTIILTANIGASKAAQIATDRAKDRHAWAEHDIQDIVEQHWKNSCTLDMGQEQGMIGFAKMVKLVDRFLAFNALSPGDMQRVFDKLLWLENKTREKNRYKHTLPLHERRPIVWDHQVTEELAASRMLGGYSSGFARQGAAKCLEAVEQMLDLLEEIQCEPDDYEKQYRFQKGNRGQQASTLDIEVICERSPQIERVEERDF